MGRDNDIPLEFPANGIDVTREFQLQPPLTTPEAVNVRVMDTLAFRRRGGSRPGLVKYVAEQVRAAPNNEIQHLNVIVDPTTAALTQNFDSPTGDWEVHPRFSDILLEPGGSGNQPNPNADQPAEANLAIALEQSMVDGYDVNGTQISENFDQPVGVNDLVLVFVVTSSTTTGITVTVQNGAFDNFTQVGSYVRRIKGATSEQMTLSLWRRVADAGASDRIVRTTPSVACKRVVGALEFSGVHRTSPVDGTSTNTGSAATLTTGAISIAANGAAILAAYCGVSAPDTVTPDVGYTLELNHPDGTIDNSDIQFFAVYRLAVDPPETPNPGVTYAGGADDFAALGISLRN